MPSQKFKRDNIKEGKNGSLVQRGSQCIHRQRSHNRTEKETMGVHSKYYGRLLQASSSTRKATNINPWPSFFSQGSSSRRLCPGQSTSDTSPRGYFAVLADEERMKQQERRNRIRNYVRFVVDEHKSIKAMGITETISLFRLSAACTKPDVVEARQRAMSVSKYNPSTASTKYNPATNHHMRSRVPMSNTIRAF